MHVIVMVRDIEYMDVKYYGSVECFTYDGVRSLNFYR